MEDKKYFYKPIESKEELKKMIDDTFSSHGYREHWTETFRRCNPVGWQAVEKAIDEEWKNYNKGKPSFFKE